MALKSVLFLLAIVLVFTTRAQALNAPNLPPPVKSHTPPPPPPPLVKPPPYSPAPPLVKPPPCPPAPPPLVKPPTPPPHPPVKPPPPPAVKPPTVPPVWTIKECTPLCGARCKLHSKKKVCLRACKTCCKRCKCVPPPGPYAKKDWCGKCYGGITSHLKCP